MKAGYSEAAWRLFQSSLTVRPDRNGVLTWADTELAGTPFGRPVPLPVVRIRGDHGTRPSPGLIAGTPDEKRDQGRGPSGRRP
jgi:hypothetical protein